MCCCLVLSYFTRFLKNTFFTPELGVVSVVVLFFCSPPVAVNSHVHAHHTAKLIIQKGRATDSDSKAHNRIIQYQKYKGQNSRDDQNAD